LFLFSKMLPTHSQHVSGCVAQVLQKYASHPRVRPRKLCPQCITHLKRPFVCFILDCSCGGQGRCFGSRCTRSPLAVCSARHGTVQHDGGAAWVSNPACSAAWSCLEQVAVFTGLSLPTNCLLAHHHLKTQCRRPTAAAVCADSQSLAPNSRRSLTVS
jgi:hypothetical protein